MFLICANGIFRKNDTLFDNYRELVQPYKSNCHRLQSDNRYQKST